MEPELSVEDSIVSANVHLLKCAKERQNDTAIYNALLGIVKINLVVLAKMNSEYDPRKILELLDHAKQIKQNQLNYILWNRGNEDYDKATSLLADARLKMLMFMVDKSGI